MSDLEHELHYTEAEAARAFEWLREQALSTSGAYWGRPAAIMLAEVSKLKDRERYVQGGVTIPKELADGVVRYCGRIDTESPAAKESYTAELGEFIRMNCKHFISRGEDSHG